MLRTTLVVCKRCHNEMEEIVKSKIGLSAALACVLVASSWAPAALLSWDFGTSNGTAVTFASTVNDPGIAAAALVRGSGFGADEVYVDNTRGAFNTNSGSTFNDLAASVAGNAFIQLAMVIDPSSTASVSSVSGFAYSQNRVRSFEVLYSFDGFATAGASAGSFGVAEDFGGNAFLLDTSGVGALQGVSGTVTMRLHLLDVTGGGFEMRGLGQKAGDSVDLAINGVVAVIPEPAALGLLAPAMLLLARRR